MGSPSRLDQLLAGSTITTELAQVAADQEGVMTIARTFLEQALGKGGQIFVEVRKVDEGYGVNVRGRKESQKLPPRYGHNAHGGYHHSRLQPEKAVAHILGDIQHALETNHNDIIVNTEDEEQGEARLHTEEFPQTL